MVTIFYLLARLLYWSRSSREVIFTMQGSRTACITQKKRTHKSGCPVSIFLRHIIYVSPWVTPPLMLPSRPSLPKHGQQSPHTLNRILSFKIYIKISTYHLVLLLFGHVVGQMQGVCFMSINGLDLMSCIMHSSPSFSAWYVHQMSWI